MNNEYREYLQEILSNLLRGCGAKDPKRWLHLVEQILLDSNGKGNRTSFVISL